MLVKTSMDDPRPPNPAFAQHALPGYDGKKDMRGIQASMVYALVCRYCQHRVRHREAGVQVAVVAGKVGA